MCQKPVFVLVYGEGVSFPSFPDGQQLSRHPWPPPPPPRGRTDQYGLNSLRKVGTGAHSRRWADKVKWGGGVRLGNGVYRCGPLRPHGPPLGQDGPRLPEQDFSLGPWRLTATSPHVTEVCRPGEVSWWIAYAIAPRKDVWRRRFKNPPLFWLWDRGQCHRCFKTCGQPPRNAQRSLRGRGQESSTEGPHSEGVLNPRVGPAGKITRGRYLENHSSWRLYVQHIL